MSEPNYESLLVNETPDALFAVAPDATVLFWNRGAELTFGYSSKEAVGRSFYDLIVPADAVAADEAFQRAAMKNGFANCETLRRKKDGSIIYANISMRAVWSAPGELQCFVRNTKDVTYLKVQRDTKLVEARYRDLLESTPDAIVIINNTGRIVLVNGQAEAVFGYARAELLGQPIEILLPPRYRSGHVGHRGGYFSQPRPRPMGAGLELSGMRKNGEEFPVEISLSPLETEEGTLAMSAIRDVTERKRIERALQEKNQEMEKAVQAKDRFLASMSHELRTPLNAILGFTGTLLMKLPGPLNANQDKQLRTIQTSAKHLLSLINDLLDLTRIESGNVELRLVPIACGEVVNEVAATLKLLAESKGVALNISLPEEEITVPTDRRALSQILLNLANNALKFTEAGSVSIAVRRQMHDSAGVVEFVVTDTGIGIGVEDQAKLFAAFTQIDNSSTRRYEGTGLGLHLSQKLAALIGGVIIVESEPGKGSRFTLSLPAA